MSQPTEHDNSSELQRLREEAQRARTDLAETVDALAAKADVKSRVQDKADQTKAQAQQKIIALSAQAKDKAGQAREAARDNPVPATVLATTVVAVAFGVRRQRTRRRSGGGRR